jgi:DNA-binding beta-propeller fold protein YncE
VPNLFKHFKILRLLGILLLACFSFGIVQNSVKSSNHSVKWISQISLLDEYQKDKSFLSSIVDFLTGTESTNLIKPISITLSGNNKIWILDQGINSPLFIDNDESGITLFNDDEEFHSPSMVGICKFEKDEILYTDSKLNKIYKCDPSEEIPFVLNDTLKLNQPTGIAYSESTNEIWVVETASHQITILDLEGNYERSIGKRGTNPGEFNFPTFIWIDKNGLIYINDSMNFRVQVLDSKGNVISVFGENGDATGYFARSKGIASDSFGNIYVVDALFNTVQIFDIEGNFLFNFGKQGKGEEEFWLPAGIYIDVDDKIYVADSYNSRVQIFQLMTNN